MSLLSALRPHQTLGWTALTVIPLALLGVAWVSQHHFDMQPCPWCVLQRLIYLGLAAAGLLGLALRSAEPRMGLAALAAVLALAGTGAALWQFMVAEQSAGCQLTLADKVLMALNLPLLWPDFFEPRASCAEAAVELLGLTYAGWSLLAFQGLEVLALALAFSARRR
jgi:disulfide bond formation protein DsbB